ncbi:response regulator transcription factor [candidate division KSB1 bacterium]|nr:response regulator transcription factor [candidate division KSB1 bacterium]
MEKGKIFLLGNQNGHYGALAQKLRDDGFTIMDFDDIEKISESTREEKPRAVLINVDVFGDDGLELCRRLKENFETRKSAIILYSEDESENNVIKGFEIGADDFITSRNSPRELIARLKSIVRRIETSGNNKIKVKDIEIDLDEHKVKKSGKPIDLTYIQFKLLYLLASRRDNVFSRKEILEKVWGRKVYVTNRTVDVHIKRLREKLGEYKYPSQYIETIHGTGYRFL